MVSLIVLGLMELVRGALVFSLLPLFGQYRAGFSMALIGTAISLHYLFDNIFRLPAGWVVDRFGGKVLTLTGIAVSGAGVTLIYLHSSKALFVLGASIFGLGISPLWPSVITGVTSRMESGKSGEALSKVYIAWLVGAGAGPVVINFVLVRSYEGAFLVVAGALATAFALTVALKIPRPAPREIPPLAVRLRELGGEIVRLRLLYPGMFVQTLSIGVLMPIVTIYAKRVFGLSPEQFNYLLVGGGIFTVLLLIPSGKMADRLGVKRPLIGGFMLAAICLLLLPLQKQVTGALIVGSLLGISYSIILPAWNGLMARAVSPEKRGTMWAVFMTIEGLGTAVGAYLSGWVWDVFGQGAPFYVSALFLGTMAVFYTLGHIEKQLLISPQKG